MVAFMAKLTGSRATFPGVTVDLALNDGGFQLGPWGISGKVLYTPGHTSGSMSVLLDNGQAFVGGGPGNEWPANADWSGYAFPC